MTTIYVGNLPFSATEQDIKALFERHGKVDSVKLINFESGIPSVGNARQPMGIKYFLVAILFVLFDVEVIFFYPYAVNFRYLGKEGFIEVVLFVAFLNLLSKVRRAIPNFSQSSSTVILSW